MWKNVEVWDFPPPQVLQVPSLFSMNCFKMTYLVLNVFFFWKVDYFSDTAQVTVI